MFCKDSEDSGRMAHWSKLGAEQLAQKSGLSAVEPGPRGLLRTRSRLVEPVMCGGGAGVGARSLAILFKVGWMYPSCG